MGKKSSLLLLAVLSIANIGQSYGMNFISGVTSIVHNGNSYLWVQNSLKCEIQTRAWISSYSHSDINEKISVRLKENLMENEKAVLMMKKEEREDISGKWLNILQWGDCSEPRLTRLKLYG